jgi:hypothetical protein
MTRNIRILFVLGMIPGALIVHIIGALLGADSATIVVLQFIALFIQLGSMFTGWYLSYQERKKLKRRIKELDIELEERRKDLINSLYPSNLYSNDNNKLNH